MSQVSEPSADPFVVFAAWHCAVCDVQGRSPDTALECWNCGGDVTVTARPTIRFDDYQLASHPLVPVQRNGRSEDAGSAAAGEDGATRGADLIHPWG